MSIGFVDAIGLFGTALGTIDFLVSNFPAANEAEGATVRIKGEKIPNRRYPEILLSRFAAGLPELTAEDDSLVGLVMLL